MIISSLNLLRTRNVANKSSRENQNTHFIFSNVFPKVVPFMRYVEKYGTAVQATDDNIIQRMRTACWITKATSTHSEYVILIAFPRQQSLRERASILHFYAHCFEIAYNEGRLAAGLHPSKFLTLNSFTSIYTLCGPG
jgi:hypothetical protein